MVKDLLKKYKTDYNRISFSLDDIVEAKKVISKFSEKKTEEDIFYDLCFAIIAPQAKHLNMLKAIEMLKEKDFYRKNIRKNVLLKITSLVRFKNRKSEFLLEMKKNYKSLYTMILHLPSDILRNRIVKDVKGIGLKAASHFLRNIGHEKFAIIDTHILKFLNVENKNITPKQYKKLESDFRLISEDLNLTPAVLDALVWKHYSKTKWSNFVY